MKPRVDAEVLIVGGGPAGSAAAITLARAGVDVLIVDRARFPRPKACGDCASPAAEPILARLGVLDALLALRPARQDGWLLWSPGDRLLPVRYPPGQKGFGVDRATLDALFLRRAEAAGARVRTGVRVHDLVQCARRVHGVRVRDGDGRLRELRTSIVVGADGLRSIVAARAGAVRRPPRLRKVSFTMHVPARFRCESESEAGLSDPGELHVRRGLCVGIAPVRAPGEAGLREGERMVNVTLVLTPARYNAFPPTCRAAELQRVVEESVGDRYAFRWSEASPPIASGPFDRPMSRVAGPGWALVGDAAGYYDPFTGQGIYQALAGGERLGQLIAEAAEARGAPLERAWPPALRTLTRESRLLQHGIEAVVSRPAICDRAFSLLAESPGLSRALGAVTGDLEPPRGLLRPGRVAALAGVAARALRLPGRA